MVRPVEGNHCYHIRLKDDRWWIVIAKCGRQAVDLLLEWHFKGVPIEEFWHKYNPDVVRIHPQENINVAYIDGLVSRTAQYFADKNLVGPFVSNTYEV